MKKLKLADSTNNANNTKDDSSEDTYAGNTNTTTKSVEWSIENEEILVEWCDIAQCYKWLNTRAHNRFSFLHAWFTIPTIILSTITGTASFGQTALPEDMQKYSPIIIGTVNIFIGIMTTIQQYLKISELNESHRVMAIAWDKFARNIKIEISKAPTERMDAGHFIKHTRQEFDRLMETSPMVPLSVINQFNATFIGKEGSKQWKKFRKIKKPDICDTLTSSNTYRHHWYVEKLKSLKYNKYPTDSEEDTEDEFLGEVKQSLGVYDEQDGTAHLHNRSFRNLMIPFMNMFVGGGGGGTPAHTPTSSAKGHTQIPCVTSIPSIPSIQSIPVNTLLPKVQINTNTMSILENMAANAATNIVSHSNDVKNISEHLEIPEPTVPPSPSPSPSPNPLPSRDANIKFQRPISIEYPENNPV
jgi:hypothetical protein